jgi:hypothetical protein
VVDFRSAFVENRNTNETGELASMRAVTAFCLVMAPIALVHAQLEVIGDSPPSGDQAALQAQGAKLQTDFNAAQAKATRKGDDKMTCDQIHADLVTTMQSPGFQQFLVQQQSALSSISASTGLSSFAVLIGMQSLLTQGAVGSGAAASAAQPASGDAAAKKTGLFKKLGSFGQIAGAAASGLGGVGHGVGSAAGTVETVAGAAQVAGAAGTAGNTTGEVAAAANAANVLNGGNAGTAAAAGVANSAAAVSNVHAAQSAGSPHASAAAAPSYNAAASQALSANAMQAALQVGQAAVNSPDVMRASHLGQLADSKGCKFQMDGTLLTH